MSIELTQKALEIRSVQTTVETAAIPADEAALSNLLRRHGVAAATVILWQVERIRCGRWSDGAFSFPDGAALRMEHVLELRAFNADSELHLTRRNDGLAGRFRRDGAGETAAYVDSMARLWGSCADADADWMTLRDADRKLELRLPVTEEMRTARADGKPVFAGLVTRSYIGIHATGQAGYVDHRYHSIVSADMEG